MKTFTRNYKINFVDDANVFVGFDNEQSCCESFGYFLSHNLPTGIKNGPDQEAIDATGYNFDTSFFKTLHGPEFDEGGMAIFRLTKGDQELFLAIYNSHNGYYSHGFNMTVGGTTIQSGSL